MKKALAGLAILLTFTSLSTAQTRPSSDELFTQARAAAFTQKNFKDAKELALQALAQSPGYAEVSVFLGRLYAWTGQYDSARVQFASVLYSSPSDEEASKAYADLENWNGHYRHALDICESGLNAHPASGGLLLRKAKNLMALGRYPDAVAVTRQLLARDPRDSGAHALAVSLRDATSRNKVTLGYGNSSFDKLYNRSWHLADISYGRITRLGTFIARLNYANRFGKGGLQGEVDAYPHISKRFYAYVNAGYSGASTVFPCYRAGFSLYANLPGSFEAEAGFRYLYFSSPTGIYTASVGKYWKNFLFSARTFITPELSNVSQSYTVSSRYYLKRADDYIGFTAGTGISPDDNNQNIQYSGKLPSLSSHKISLDFSRTFRKWNVISLGAGWINEEYLPSVKGNQYNLSVGLSHRF